MKTTKDYLEKTVDREAPPQAVQESPVFIEEKYDLCQNGEVDSLVFQIHQVDEEKAEHIPQLLQENQNTSKTIFTLKQFMIIMGALVVVPYLSIFAAAGATAILAKVGLRRGGSGSHQHKAQESGHMEKEKYSGRSLSSDEDYEAAMYWIQDLLSLYEVCGGTCPSKNIPGGMMMSFPYNKGYSDMHFWMCKIGDPSQAPPIAFMNEIKGNTFFEEQQFGLQNFWGGVPSILLSDGINDVNKVGSGSALAILVVLCSGSVPSGENDQVQNSGWFPLASFCPGFVKSISYNPLQECKSDFDKFLKWSSEFTAKYEICSQECSVRQMSIPDSLSFKYNGVYYWACDKSNPMSTAPPDFLDQITGNSFVEAKHYGLASISIPEMALYCSSNAPLGMNSKFSGTCPEMLKNIQFNKLQECTGCKGISSASSAGGLISAISNCSGYQESWVSFDNTENEESCYSAISSYVTNGLPNELRSYYYKRMYDSGTWQSLLLALTFNQYMAGKCSSSKELDTIKTQLLKEVLAINQLYKWRTSMLAYIAQTQTTLKNHLDGVNGIMKLQARDVIPPPSGLPTWAKAIMGVVQVASAAAPGVLESEEAIKVAQGVGALVEHAERYLDSKGSGASYQDDPTEVSVGYDHLVGTTLPSSFKNMTDAVNVIFTAIAGDYGKLMAFNKLVYPKYAVPGTIDFADAMGVKKFQDIYEFQAWSLLFPVKYGICYQSNPYRYDTMGSCVSWDVQDDMKIYIDDTHNYFWPCEHSHPNLVPPTAVLDDLKDNSFAKTKGYGIRSPFGDVHAPFYLSDGGASAGTAITGMAILCNSHAPDLDEVSFSSWTTAYSANCTSFAWDITFTEVDKCTKYHNSLGGPNPPPGAA